MSGTILIADFGGTTLRFALSRAATISRLREMAADQYASLDEAIAAYLDPVPKRDRPRRAVFASAGPPDGVHVVFTNRSWRTPAAALRARFGLEALVMVNDFAANAYSLPHLHGKELRTLGPNPPPVRGPMVVVGPGTGLGVAALLPEGETGWRAVPGEGGHASLPSQNDTEDQVIWVMRRRFGHVSAERALSGPGLSHLHDALRVARNLPQRHLDAKTIASQAASDPVCAETVALFTDFLATVAGDLALTFDATGGVFIAGGITPKLGHLFVAERFRERFTAKGRFSERLEGIATRLILHPCPALVGLARASESILDTSA